MRWNKVWIWSCAFFFRKLYSYEKDWEENIEKFEKEIKVDLKNLEKLSPISSISHGKKSMPNKLRSLTWMEIDHLNF